MSGMQTNEIKPVPLNDYVSLHWSSPTLVHYSSETLTLTQLSEPIKPFNSQKWLMCNFSL